MHVVFFRDGPFDATQFGLTSGPSSLTVVRRLDWLEKVLAPKPEEGHKRRRRERVPEWKAELARRARGLLRDGAVLLALDDLEVSETLEACQVIARYPALFWDREVENL